MKLIFKLEKDKTREDVEQEIVIQLTLITDLELLAKVKTYLQQPALDVATWDYSETKSQYPVWLTVKSENDDTGIIFSEYGFSNARWGLVKLSEYPFHFGADYSWFETLEEAFRNSWMSE